MQPIGWLEPADRNDMVTLALECDEVAVYFVRKTLKNLVLLGRVEECRQSQNVSLLPPKNLRKVGVFQEVV